jgi:hypothetical protein
MSAREDERTRGKEIYCVSAAVSPSQTTGQGGQLQSVPVAIQWRSALMVVDGRAGT